MPNKILIAVASVVYLLIPDSGQTAEFCNRRGGYRLTSGDGSWPMYIQIRSGSTCQATFGSVGSTGMEFKQLSLVAAPSRGKLKLRQGGYYIYTAPGSPGSDAFTLQLCGKQDGKDGCAKLQYSVTVN